MTLAVVLAAGKGTRMKSDLPKVLHRLGGRALVAYPIAAAREAGVDQFVVVVGHGAEQVEQAVLAEQADGVAFVVQAEQNGTGHAVLCALPAFSDYAGMVLILSGDVPLLEARTLRRLIAAAEGSPARFAFLTFRPDQPGGYGRIIRDEDGHPVAIREHADASEAQRAITEVNAGIYCVAAEHLRRELPKLGPQNAQGEIYLTDLVARLAKVGAIEAIEVDAAEVAGVNTLEQLAQLESMLAGG